MRSLLTISLLILVLPPLGNAQQNPQPDIKDSRRGFDKEYKTVLKAFQKSDEGELRLRFAEFVLPPHWFIDTFGPELGARLADRYSQEFPKFVYATLNLFGSVSAAQDKYVETHVLKYDHNANPTPTPAPPSLVPMPPVWYFGIDYGGSHPNRLPDGMWNTPWRGTFIYVDGAFRFFGLDAYPFWDLRDDEPGGFCADPRVQGGQVVHRVKPVYPTGAKRKHIRGTVLMYVTIGTDGSVKQVEIPSPQQVEAARQAVKQAAIASGNPLLVEAAHQGVMKAEIVSGNPLLVEAARQAVMQWHYYPPPRKCSQPVEGTATESVQFPPH